MSTGDNLGSADYLIHDSISNDLLEGRHCMAVLGRGLGVHRVLLNILVAEHCINATRHTGITLVLNTPRDEAALLVEEFNAVAGEIRAHLVNAVSLGRPARKKLYEDGNCILFGEAHVLISDLLTPSVLNIFQLNGIIVYNCHRMTDVSSDTFLVREVRRQLVEAGKARERAELRRRWAQKRSAAEPVVVLGNRMPSLDPSLIDPLPPEPPSSIFIRGLSENAVAFSTGFNQVDKAIKRLGARRLALWPRYSVLIKRALGKRQLDVLELHCTMSPLTKELHNCLEQLLQEVLDELSRSTRLLPIEGLTVERAMFREFSVDANLRLGSDWFRQSPKTKQLLKDVTTLRRCLLFLLRYDCVSFLRYLENVRSDQSRARISTWLFQPASEKAYKLAQRRVHVATVSRKRMPESPRIEQDSSVESESNRLTVQGRSDAEVKDSATEEAEVKSGTDERDSSKKRKRKTSTKNASKRLAAIAAIVEATEDDSVSVKAGPAAAFSAAQRRQILNQFSSSQSKQQQEDSSNREPSQESSSNLNESIPGPSSRSSMTDQSKVAGASNVASRDDFNEETIYSPVLEPNQKWDLLLQVVEEAQQLLVTDELPGDIVVVVRDTLLRTQVTDLLRNGSQALLTAYYNDYLMFKQRRFAQLNASSAVSQGSGENVVAVLEQQSIQATEKTAVIDVLEKVENKNSMNPQQVAVNEETDGGGKTPTNEPVAPIVVRENDYDSADDSLDEAKNDAISSIIVKQEEDHSGEVLVVKEEAGSEMSRGNAPRNGSSSIIVIEDDIVDQQSRSNEQMKGDGKGGNASEKGERRKKGEDCAREKNRGRTAPRARVVVQTMHDRRLLEETKPSIIVMYDPDLDFVRQLEVYRAAMVGAALRVYLLGTEQSVELRMYMNAVQRENDAFELLIKEKAAHVRVEGLDEDLFTGAGLFLKRGRILAGQVALPSRPSGSGYGPAGATISAITAASALDPSSSASSPAPLSQSATNSSAAEATTGEEPISVAEFEEMAAEKAEEKTARLIVVDSREFRSELPAMLHREGFRVLPLTLSVGDYVLTSSVCIERKSLSDLIGSLNSGRLISQAEGMCRLFQKPCLLIEFKESQPFMLEPPHELGDTVTLMSTRGRLCSLLRQFPRLRVLWSRSAHHTARLFRLLKQDQPDPQPEVLNVEAAEAAEANEPLEILRAMPGIRSDNLPRLLRLEEVSTVADVALLSQEKLCEVLGMVPGRQLYTFLHAKAEDNAQASIQQGGEKVTYNVDLRRKPNKKTAAAKKKVQQLKKS